MRNVTQLLSRDAPNVGGESIRETREEDLSASAVIAVFVAERRDTWFAVLNRPKVQRSRYFAGRRRKVGDISGWRSFSWLTASRYSETPSRSAIVVSEECCESVKEYSQIRGKNNADSMEKKMYLSAAKHIVTSKMTSKWLTMFQDD